MRGLLGRRLGGAKAENDAGRIGQGSRTDLGEHRADGTKSRGTNQAAHLLRRLARSHPAVLAAWAPTAVAGLFGSGALFHLEDG